MSGPSDTPARPPRVLVVDDNQDAADILAEFVTLLGGEARAVYRASDAVETARTADFDVVLVDLRLPDGDGASVARAVRERSDATLVALTGFATEDVADQLAAGGFDGCLTKPCSLDALRGLLERPRRPPSRGRPAGAPPTP